MKKRALAFILFLTMIISAFSGCRSLKKPENEKITAKKPVAAEKNPTQTEDITYIDDTDEFEIGTVEDGIYENNFFDIRCEFTDWTYDDREALVEELNDVEQYLKDNTESEDFIESLENSSQFFDMKAFAPDGMTNANIVVTKNDIGYSFDEKLFWDKILAGSLAVMEDAGFTINSSEVKEVDINGVSKHIAILDVELNGVEMVLYEIVVIKKSHVAMMTITASDEKAIDDICKNIYFD